MGWSWKKRQKKYKKTGGNIRIYVRIHKLQKLMLKLTLFIEAMPIKYRVMY